MHDSPEPPAVVLVVDDDPAIRALVRRHLERDELHVVEADGLTEAREAIDRRLPDLVILDLGLPDGRGEELCRELRNHSTARGMPVLVLTGSAAPDVVAEAYEAGATDFVTKPVSGDVLRYRTRYQLRSGRAFRQLRDSRSSLASAQRIARVGNWEVRPDGRLACSEQLLEVFGLGEQGPVELETLLERVHPEDRERVMEAWDGILQERRPHSVVYRVCLDDGAVQHVHQQATVEEGAHAPRLLGTVQDVTEQKQAEDKIRFLAFRDVLTGLPNRRLLKDRLAQAVFQAKRHDRRLAVLHVDIDGFKAINDGFGHVVGDELLRQVGERLRGCVRDSDTVAREDGDGAPTVSRSAGDEFVIVLTELDDAASAAGVARRIAAEIGRPFMLQHAELLVTVSIGISQFPEDGADAELLMRRADLAMASVKEEGGNDFRFYGSAMNTDAVARLALASRLHRALAEEQFHLVYQPICATDSEAITSVEALLRWEHPQRGQVPPGDFIPVAEESGLIVPIGAWVIEEACAQWRRWRDSGVGEVEISVNVSGRQFRDAGLVEKIERVTERRGMDPGWLRLELTEHELMRYTGQTGTILGRLRQMGVRLAVDDFGTGHSSLSYLRRFPVDVLKVDQSFVRGVPDSPEDCRLVAAIVAMAQKLCLRVVAEGVETRRQLEFLRPLECDDVQGYLLARPARAEKIEPLLRSRLRARGGSSEVLSFHRPA